MEFLHDEQPEQRRHRGPWRTIANFYLHLIDEAVENPVNVVIDPPSRAVADFVVNFLMSRGSMGK